MSSQPTTSPQRQLVFGPFVFDEASGELHKHGIRMRLEGQPLQILMALIRQPGQVVTRDEFQQQLWKGGTFVDFEHGLNAAMNRLRQALGDSADQPRYIETLAGRGYRFVAAVQTSVQKPILVMASAPVAAEVESAAAAPVIVHTKARAWLLWVAAGIIGGLIVGYLATSRKATSVAQTLRYSISPPNGYALEAGSSRQTFALSPDGAHLALRPWIQVARFGLLFAISMRSNPGRWPIASIRIPYSGLRMDTLFSKQCEGSCGEALSRAIPIKCFATLPRPCSC
jgi:DNA-binding winged helix-turn-helix (wHTH) protein